MKRGFKFTIFGDGGSRGNPGEAAIGVIIKTENDKVLVSFNKTIGITTNNIAEYSAIIEALIWLKKSKMNSELNNLRYCFYLDSLLVVNQLNGLFKIKDSHLRQLLLTIRGLEAEIGGNVSYTYIPREKNKQADFLVNQALDKKMNKVGF